MSLLKSLCNDYREYELFQWILLMKQYYEKEKGMDFFKHVNFGASISLAMRASDIESIEVDAQNLKMQLNIGLLGNVRGPLDYYYIDELSKKMRSKDMALIDIINIFNHKFVEIFYQSYETFAVQMNKQYYEDFLTSLQSNIMEKNADITDFYWSKNLNLSSLQSWLKYFLTSEMKIDVSMSHKMFDVKQFQGKIGEMKLGKDCVIGKYVYQANSVICIDITMNDIHEYTQMLPNQPKITHIIKKIKKNLDFPYSILVKIICKDKGMKNPVLGKSYLGYGSSIDETKELINVHEY